MEIRDRVAIVTGAARGIGRATAEMLAAEGARAVVLVDRKAPELEEAASRVKAGGAEALPFHGDVGDLDTLRRLFDETHARYGRLDVLHNNAGIGEGTCVWPDVPAERVGAICDVNLRGVILGTQLALEPMRECGGGVVINTASGGAFIPLPPQAVYVATKAGVVHFTRSCAPLAESHGVRVNCVCPGLVDTAMVQETGHDGPADWLRPLVEATVMLRPEDIARAVLDLIRDDSKVAEIVSVDNAR